MDKNFELEMYGNQDVKLASVCPMDKVTAKLSSVHRVPPVPKGFKGVGNVAPHVMGYAQCLVIPIIGHLMGVSLIFKAPANIFWLQMGAAQMGVAIQLSQ
jgi:hypothetical protein